MSLKSVRARLLATSVMTAASLAGLSAAPAVAQDAPAAELSEVVVTGSRLPRPNIEQPTPVAVLSSRTIENAGPQSLGDLIARLPEAGDKGTLRANSNNFGNGAGVSSADLRGLGVSRTLVLVDGQRHVAGDLTTNAVDLNSIPPALVDRVEVITGGASAIYGSDAVSGVVNIITKKKFEGLQAEAELGGYDNGFGAKYSASVTGGRNFLDDRLNVAVTGVWRKEAGINARDLPGAHNYGLIVNPADVPGGVNLRFGASPTPNNGIPDRLWVPNVGSEMTTRNGVLINMFTGEPLLFDKAGNPVPTPQRTGYNSFGFGQLPADCANCFFPEDNLQIASPLETKGLALHANMDFSDHLHGFVDAKYMQNEAQNAIQPSISTAFTLEPDNAFLTPAIRAALGSTPAQAFVISRFLNDGREQDYRRRTYRIVAGLNGDFDAGFAAVKWDGALNYGETDTRILDHNLMITENFAAALDSVIDPATGQPACRINVPSAPQSPDGIGAGAINPRACVPYNPFGQLNGPNAMAYSFGTFGIKDRLTQQVANLNASFDTSRFFNLPGGPIGVAVGGEYRMERTQERNDPLLLAGATENAATDSGAGYNVTEGYVEISAPVLREAGPLLDELTFDAAYRGAHYSTVGGVSAYKLSGIYGPAKWLKFRGTYSRAIRAPNITEAFQPVSAATFTVRDPCSVENIGSNVNFAANCAAAGLPTGFVATSNLAVPGSVSGNANLDPETSISYTTGFVLQPPMVPNLAVTLDYYSIKIRDAITQVDAQSILDNCYGSTGGLDQTYCSLFTRGGRQNISSIHTTYVNASKLITDGFELQVSYAADVAPLTQRWRYTRALDGRMSFNLTADYLIKLRNFPFQQNPEQVNVLEGVASEAFGNNPQLKGVAELDYQQGPVSVAWTTRYIGKQALFSRDPSAADHSEALNIPFTEPTFYHDLTVRYRLAGQMQGTELYVGAQNLFDERPPFTVIDTVQGAGFDLGRFLFVGARYRR